MAGLVNKAPALLSRKGWDSKTFVAHCMLIGIGSDTAYRLVRGDTNFTTQTLAVFAKVLDVTSISDIIDIEVDKPDGS